MTILFDGVLEVLLLSLVLYSIVNTYKNILLYKNRKYIVGDTLDE